MSKIRNPQQPKHLEPLSESSLASLIRAIKIDEQEPLSCAECRKNLATLLHKHQPGATLSADDHAILAHLATCSACSAEYDALQTAMVAFKTGMLPTLPQPYHFDLSFITPSAPETIQERPPLWTKLFSEKLWSLSDEIQILLEAGRASFQSLPALLIPTTTPGEVLRSELSDSQLEVLVLPAADAEFSVHLAVGPMIAGKAAVVVKLVEIANARPLADTLITLRNSQRQLLVGFMSGQDGTAIFEQLPLGRYFVQIRFNQHTWEIPLVIVGGSIPS